MAVRRSGPAAFAVTAGLLVLVASGCGSSRHASVAAGSIGYATWSPDGGRIAWGEGIRGAARQRMWIADADMSHAHPVTPPLDSLGEIAWLRDGRLLYWLNSRLFLLTPGGRSRELSPFAGDGFAVDPRGRRIATGGPSCSTGCNGGVFVLDLRGNVRKVSPNTQSTNPTFSPDGRRIAFARSLCDATGRCDRPVGIWAAWVATGRLRRLTQTGCCPSWSPDGACVAYVENLLSGGRLRVVRIRDRRSGSLLSVTGRTLSTPAWSPDGRLLAVVESRFGGGSSRLLIVNVATRRVRPVRGIGGALPDVFAWSPDSSELLATARDGPIGCLSLWLLRVSENAARLLRRC